MPRCRAVLAQPAAADHRLAAVHHQQPEARDRAVQGRRRRLDAGAERAARPSSSTSGWPRSPRRSRAYNTAHPDKPAAPFAINQIVHKSNDRLEHDMAMCAKYKVPIVITSLGARTDVNDAVHAWGGIVLHDIINNTFAKKAIEKGADGLIAVAAGAGGHAGVKSPFALIAGDPRRGSTARSRCQRRDRHRRRGAGRAGDGRRLRLHRLGLHRDRRGARARGLQADDRRGHAATTSSTRNLFTGVHGNYLQGLDPRRRPGPRQPARERPEQDELRRRAREKAWKDIWGCGQGIGAVKEVVPARVC